ncbi:MAG: helix-turn-helix domain-containing protein [Candidatus Nanoarchaeia archaeon]|nr:helix-turn-helix domain-containing protein [Candidatus Nanoarchaeia archaeon]MDD5741001.1 helix-turn-helix domain-containing protein [Candidatus Nanoarchaeia archaeon]
MDTSLLLKAGLTKNEIKVYVILLEIGESTSGPLIKKVGINSSKVYESLERLGKKGLISYVKKTNKRYFRAANPERILDYIDEKQRNLEEEKTEINKIIHELKAGMKKSGEELQEATIFVGLKGYRTLLENMLSELKYGGKYLAFASGMLKEVLGEYWFIFQDKKKKYKIKARCLWDPKVRKQKDYLREYYGNGRFISKGSYLSPVDLWIFNDKIIQVSYTTKPIFAVLIRSKGLAQSYKELFETLWRIAKR